MTTCDGCKTRIKSPLEASQLAHHPAGATWDFCVACTNKILKLFSIDDEVKESPLRRNPFLVDAEETAPPANNALTPEEIERLGL